MFQRVAFEELHGDEGDAIFVANFIDGADIRVIERGGGARFAAKSFEGLRILRDIFGKKFEGDETAEVCVFGFVDDAHAATTEFFDDAVVGNCVAEHGGVVGHRGRILRPRGGSGQLWAALRFL